MMQKTSLKSLTTRLQTTLPEFRALKIKTLNKVKNFYGKLISVQHGYSKKGWSTCFAHESMKNKNQGTKLGIKIKLFGQKAKLFTEMSFVQSKIRLSDVSQLLIQIYIY